MSIAQALIQEMEHEAATTRRFLENLPADKLNWQPHEKSLTAGQLAMHIATCQGQIASMVSQDECPPPDFAGGFPQPGTVQEVIDAHEASVKTAVATLSGFDDTRMMAEWKLVAGGNELMKMPRAAVCRSIMMNHVYHHRGQLGIYLRLLGATVPWAYGPSGDETPPEFQKMLDAMAVKG